MDSIVVGTASHIARKISLICLVLALASCNESAPVDGTFLTARDGSKYEVVSQQNQLFAGDKMFVITYISPELDNDAIRNREFQHLYQIAADNMNPLSDYDYVALVALQKRNRSFGFDTNTGYRDRRPFADVMSLRSGGQ